MTGTLRPDGPRDDVPGRGAPAGVPDAGPSLRSATTELPPVGPSAVEIDPSPLTSSSLAALTPAVPGRGLVANVSALFTSQAITWIVTLLWSVIVPRALGPAQMGLLTIGLSSAAILGVVLALPTHDFLAREMVADRRRAAHLLGTALVVRVTLTPVMLALATVYAGFADLGRTGTVVLFLCTGAALCQLLSEPALSAFRATERMEYMAYAEVLNRTLQSFGGVALALLGFGVVALAGFVNVIAAAILVLTLVWSRRLVGIDLRVTVAGMWYTVRASAPYWITSVFYLLYLWIDAVMLGLMVPAEVVGWYGVATKLFTTLMALPALLATAWLPRLVRAYVAGGEPELAQAARTPIETVIVLSLPVCVGAALTAPGGIALLYGPEFDGAGTVLTVLALCVPAMYLSIMLNQVLIAAGRPVLWAWVLAAATVINIGLNTVFIPIAQDRYGNGAAGASAALLVTELVVIAVGLVLVGRLALAAVAWGRLLRAAAAAGVMAGVMVLVQPAGVLVSGPLGVLVFALAALLLGVLSGEQRAALRAALAGRLSRLRGPRSRT